MNDVIKEQQTPLTNKELDLMNAYWRACNYLSVGMIYLKDNPLLKEPLKTEHVKHRLLGHWGASPALSFAWVHLNRMIVKHDLDMIFVAGPGHGARAGTQRTGARHRGSRNVRLYGVRRRSDRNCDAHDHCQRHERRANRDRGRQ